MNDNMRKFVRGLMVSTVSQGVLPKKGEPVAYLYNGVQLPPLPEWDKTAYPYAIMRSYRTIISFTPSITYAQKYDLYVLSVRPYKQADYDYLGIPEDATLRSVIWSDGVWGEFGDELNIYDGAWNGYIPFWTNTDILNEDGTLYLAASEPVPVYE